MRERPARRRRAPPPARVALRGQLISHGDLVGSRITGDEGRDWNASGSIVGFGVGAVTLTAKRHTPVLAKGRGRGRRLQVPDLAIICRWTTRYGNSDGY
jgi:hypothetical protein